MELRRNAPEQQPEPKQRATRKPGQEAPEAGLLGLQRAAGNAAVARAVQRQSDVIELDDNTGGGGGGGSGGGQTGGGLQQIPLKLNLKTTARVNSDGLRAMADGKSNVAAFDSGPPSETSIET